MRVKKEIEKYQKIDYLQWSVGTSLSTSGSLAKVSIIWKSVHVKSRKFLFLILSCCNSLILKIQYFVYIFQWCFVLFSSARVWIVGHVLCHPLVVRPVSRQVSKIQNYLHVFSSFNLMEALVCHTYHKIYLQLQDLV